MQTTPPTKQTPNNQAQELTPLYSTFYTAFEHNNEVDDDDEDYQPHLNNPNSDWQQKMNKLISCH